mmetsp:Transcript_47720/g.76503  ORF Transcript_47720/g.76503 Transcript_47720/m.76503 type:complete len:91 (+) Transcript_47720:148-420(+)
MSGANPESAPNTAAENVLRMTTFLRPNLSAKIDQNKTPHSMPANTTAEIAPSNGGFSSHSTFSTGMQNDSNIISMASAAQMPPVRNMSRY